MGQKGEGIERFGAPYSGKTRSGMEQTSTASNSARLTLGRLSHADEPGTINPRWNSITEDGVTERTDGAKNQGNTVQQMARIQST